MPPLPCPPSQRTTRQCWIGSQGATAATGAENRRADRPILGVSPDGPWRSASPCRAQRKLTFRIHVDAGGCAAPAPSAIRLLLMLFCYAIYVVRLFRGGV